MFAKIFSQIFDSSIAEDWQVRCVFTDLLTLCDINGVVDMTPEAISRRTNVPLEIILRAIGELQKPDPKSRSPEDDGRRIRLIDDHRNWGWMIINHERYRKIASEEQRRSKTAERVARYKSKHESGNALVTHGNTEVTTGNSGNAMQKQKQKQKKMEEDISPERKIYDAYPKKVGRPDAFRAISKALRDVDFEVLLRATSDYAEAMKDCDRKFIPYPQKWFNSQRYNDDPETWGCHKSDDSAHDLRLKLEAKKQRMAQLRRRHFSDTQSLIGTVYHPAGWRDEAARAEYRRLSEEQKQIEQQLSL
jgi:hypothetical protein